MCKIFLCFTAFLPLTASVINISINQETFEYGTDCMGQKRPGINIHDLLYEDDQIRELIYPTHCCEDYYIRFSHSSIPTLATSSFGSRPNYVVGISMNNTNISKIMPGTFTGLSYLNCLDLSQNYISFIQDGLFNGLRQLSILNLANNNIKQISYNSFNDTNLKKLFLQNNMISSLDDTLFSSLKNSLTIINLSKNILIDINNTFVGMKSLVSLNLNYNHMEHVDLTNVYSTEIYLRNNKISRIIALGNMTQTIDLSENNIQSIEDLGTSFINSSITKLHLSRNAIQLNHNSLVGLHILTHLYLDNNKIRNISSTMFKDVKSLISLDLSHNDISQFEYNTFEHVSNLHYLNISCNKFTEPQLHKISLILVASQTIRIIDLSENEIKSIQELRRGFMNSPIEKLYLSRNEIQLEQNSLDGLHSLTHLYLDNNKIRNISKMVFKDLSSLIFLDISHNDISQLQYETFNHLSNVQYLNISFNNLTDLQLHVFSPLQKLIDLDIRNNRISELDIESLLQQCFTLRKINVVGNLWKCKALIIILKYCQAKNVEVVWGNSTDFDAITGIASDSDDFAINYVTEKNVNNDFDVRFSENSSFFNFLKEDFERSDFFDYLENLHGRKPTDAIILNSTSFYNFSNYQQSNLFKYLEYLRHRNHAVSHTPGEYFNFLFIFGGLLVAILVLILIVGFTILIVLLKKGSKSTKNISQDNVELY